jgi:hypothetical protein
VPPGNVTLPGFERRKKERKGKKTDIKRKQGKKKQHVSVGTGKGYFSLFYGEEKKRTLLLRGHRKCYCIGTVDDG